MTEIIPTVDGFVKNIRYTAYIREVLSEFEEKFAGLDALEVIIHERVYAELASPRKDPIFEVRGHRGIVRCFVQKYYDKNGSVSAVPEPVDVLSQLKEVLSIAVQQYASLSR